MGKIVDKVVSGAINEFQQVRKHEREMEQIEKQQEIERMKYKSEQRKNAMSNVVSFFKFVGRHWTVFVGIILSVLITTKMMNAIGTRETWARIVCCVIGSILWIVILSFLSKLITKYLKSEHAGEEFEKDIEWIKSHWILISILFVVNIVSIIVISIIGK